MDQKLQLFLDDQLLVASQQPLEDATGKMILVGYWDQSFACQVDGRTVWRYGLDDVATPPDTTETSAQIAIGVSHAAESSSVALSNLCLWRDLYYTAPESENSRWSLASDQYLLIGDNVPRSRDGRQGDSYGVVSRRQIRGLVRHAQP